MQAAYRWRKGGGARIDFIDGLQCPECSRPEGFYLLNEYTDRHQARRLISRCLAHCTERATGQRRYVMPLINSLQIFVG